MGQGTITFALMWTTIKDDLIFTSQWSYFVDAVQEEMLVNMDSFKTIYNAMCQFVKDQGQGQKLLYVTMVKAIGQREADRYINKVTQGLQDCALYQDVKQIVPEYRRKLLPLVFCYILMTKFCKWSVVVLFIQQANKIKGLTSLCIYWVAVSFLATVHLWKIMEID